MSASEINWDRLFALNEQRRQARPMRLRLEELIKNKPDLDCCPDEIKDLEDILAYVITLEESIARVSDKYDEARSDILVWRKMAQRLAKCCDLLCGPDVSDSEYLFLNLTQQAYKQAVQQ